MKFKGVKPKTVNRMRPGAPDDLAAAKYRITRWSANASNQILHEETGYMLWLVDQNDKHNRPFIKAIAIPSDITMLAGGQYEFPPHTKNTLTMEAEAEAGRRTYGICQDPFLEKHAQTTRFVTQMSLGPTPEDKLTLEYTETTSIKDIGENHAKASLKEK